MTEPTVRRAVVHRACRHRSRQRLRDGAGDLDVTRVRLPGITPADARRYESWSRPRRRGGTCRDRSRSCRLGWPRRRRREPASRVWSTLRPASCSPIIARILVVYDGEPMLEPIEGSRLERVANTPYAVIRDVANGSYYLNGANLVVSRRPGRCGPWTSDLASSRRGSRGGSARHGVGGSDRGPPPEIVTTIEPAELISTDGPPNYAHPGRRRVALRHEHRERRAARGQHAVDLPAGRRTLVPLEVHGRTLDLRARGPVAERASRRCRSIPEGKHPGERRGHRSGGRRGRRRRDPTDQRDSSR